MSNQKLTAQDHKNHADAIRATMASKGIKGGFWDRVAKAHENAASRSKDQK